MAGQWTWCTWRMNPWTCRRRTTEPAVSRGHGVHPASPFQHLFKYSQVRARICKPFEEPRNLFPSWGTGTTTLFDVPVRQATLASGIDSLESIPWSLKRLQIRAKHSVVIEHSSVSPPRRNRKFNEECQFFQMMCFYYFYIYICISSP